MTRSTKRKSHREKREVQIIAKKLKYDEVYFFLKKIKGRTRAVSLLKTQVVPRD